jgi:hypothetical protein
MKKKTLAHFIDGGQELPDAQQLASSRHVEYPLDVELLKRPLIRGD